MSHQGGHISRRSPGASQPSQGRSSAGGRRFSYGSDNGSDNGSIGSAGSENPHDSEASYGDGWEGATSARRGGVGFGARFPWLARGGGRIGAPAYESGWRYSDYITGGRDGGGFGRGAAFRGGMVGSGTLYGGRSPFGAGREGSRSGGMEFRGRSPTGYAGSGDESGEEEELGAYLAGRGGSRAGSQYGRGSCGLNCGSCGREMYYGGPRSSPGRYTGGQRPPLDRRPTGTLGARQAHMRAYLRRMYGAGFPYDDEDD